MPPAKKTTIVAMPMSSRAGSSISVLICGDASTAAIPASQTTASTASPRARAVSSESSRMPANTARGLWSTSSARSSQTCSSGREWAVVATDPA
jgi:hypothetical protein